ncbi:MAG: hypothetical protein NW214_01015 [Pseudanabaenaceae cyanobacterium bins.39]|nr:hypothetical protein [Pseudanabaenaceae cyanobacterium bins.39]
MIYGLAIDGFYGDSLKKSAIANHHNFDYGKTYFKITNKHLISATLN